MVHATTGAKAWQVEIEASSHRLLADEPPDNGGTNAGPNPFEYVLAGLAACTSITLRMYAQRKGWADFDVKVRLRHRVEGGRHLIDRDVEVSGTPDAAGLERLRDIVERTPVTLALKDGFALSTALDQRQAGVGP